jgi:hypothetical protein
MISRKTSTLKRRLDGLAWNRLHLSMVETSQKTMSPITESVEHSVDRRVARRTSISKDLTTHLVGIIVWNRCCEIAAGRRP